MTPVSAPSLQLAVALSSVWRALRLALQLRGHVNVMDKHDGSPLTIADIACQALIASALHRAFPNDRLIAEERYPDDEQVSQAVLALLAPILGFPPTPEQLRAWIDPHAAGTSDRTWLIDPIDGTKGFISGGSFAIALALVEGGDVTLGVIGCPSLGSIQDPVIACAEGDAAWLQHREGGALQPIRVSDQRDPAAARATGSRSADHGDLPLRDRILANLGIAAPRPLDGMGKYALIACGEAEIYMRLPHPLHRDREENSWDHAAGVAIVRCAGGRVSDAAGRPLDLAAGATIPGAEGIIVTNGYLHADVLAAIAQHWHPQR